MEKGFLFVVFLLILCLPTQGQDSWKKSAVSAPPVVCYASGKVEKSLIPPPDEILNHLKSASGKTAEIIVTYNSFPDTVRKAFEYAVEIWERLIESPVPIYVNAKWQKMSSSNTLASCGPTNYYQNFNGAAFPSCYYPIAVVERILKEEVTDSSTPDMSATFNSSVNWYFGTDGNTPYTKYDFVTTVLHELAHGLGIVGFFYVENQTAGYDTPPAVFDEYVNNRLYEQLVNSSIFTNPSATIYNHLTSGILYFRSPLFINAQEALPRLYAPNIWNDGSSVYHLNESTYPFGNENSLMTYASGMGEAIHDPGPVTMGILAEIGWKHLWIEHEKLSDAETVSVPVVASASIKSDFTLDSASVFLISSPDSFVSIDSTPMTYHADSFLFSAELPVHTEKGTISYYLSAADKKGRVFTLPSFAPDTTFTFRIGPDTIAPAIVHQPVENLMSTADKLTLEAFAEDNIGIDSVWAEYFINDQTLQTFPLVHDTLDTYSGSLPISPGLLNDGDSIRYRIVARDISSKQNTCFLPEKGFYTVNIQMIYSPVIKYANDFENNHKDFIASGFSVREETGFTGKALHSIHPYLSPERSDLSFNYTAQLKYPIILQPDGIMSFDEIVLVEPGETNSKYGDENFYDYVIAEGSKNNGETWLPLIDGYDSRAVASWEIEYNSKIVNNNSTVAGKKEMYIRRGISLLQNGNFAANDTVQIRFRLYSDPFAHGWGWAIDNLRIQSLVNAEEGLALSPGNFKIYPNPSTGPINFEYYSGTQAKSFEIKIHDYFGRLIYQEEVKNPGISFKQTIDLSAKAAGIYLIQVVSEGSLVDSRRVIKN